MPVLKFRKVDSLPGVLEANTAYLIKSSTHLVLHLTDKTGATSYSTYDATEIATIAETYINGLIGQPNGLAELDTNGDIVGDLAGNAATATKLATPRNINGQPFDGSQNITISSALAFTEVTLDFGSVGTYSKLFTINDAGAATTNKILISPSGKPATGRSADELEMDNFVCSAVCLVDGQITINAFAIPGPVSGEYKFNYSLG